MKHKNAKWVPSKVEWIRSVELDAMKEGMRRASKKLKLEIDDVRRHHAKELKDCESGLFEEGMRAAMCIAMECEGKVGSPAQAILHAIEQRKKTV